LRVLLSHLLYSLLFVLIPLYFLSFLLYPLHLLSFPTRRSSDLFGQGGFSGFGCSGQHQVFDVFFVECFHPRAVLRSASRAARQRSEEHTSELQSRENIVCRLLLEKKKKRRF